MQLGMRPDERTETGGKVRSRESEAVKKTYTEAERGRYPDVP